MSTAVERAQSALDAWDTAHQIQPTDPGVQSMRFHESQAKRDKDLTAYLNRMRRESEERERLVDALDRARRDERIAAIPDPLTPEQIQAIRPGDKVQIRRHNHTRWEAVARVNTKTVTLASIPPYDAERVTHDRIVRHQPKETA